jgi:hypothetical protein
MKLITTPSNGNKNIIKTTSKVEFELVVELEFNRAAELEFVAYVELFNIAVEFKSKSIL